MGDLLLLLLSPPAERMGGGRCGGRGKRYWKQERGRPDGRRVRRGRPVVAGRVYWGGAPNGTGFVYTPGRGRCLRSVCSLSTRTGAADGDAAPDHLCWLGGPPGRHAPPGG